MCAHTINTIEGPSITLSGKNLIVEVRLEKKIRAFLDATMQKKVLKTGGGGRIDTIQPMCLKTTRRTDICFNNFNFIFDGQEQVEDDSNWKPYSMEDV